MERSLHSRGFRTQCTFRHRCRQSPQRSIRFPSRSMWMIMYLSVSSTLVTVCAFNLSCFLKNVSMSTSILFLSVAVHHSPQKIRCIGDSDQPLHRQPAASKTLRLQLHFRDGNPERRVASTAVPRQRVRSNLSRGYGAPPQRAAAPRHRRRRFPTSPALEYEKPSPTFLGRWLQSSHRDGWLATRSHPRLRLLPKPVPRVQRRAGYNAFPPSFMALLSISTATSEQSTFGLAGTSLA